MSEHSTIAPTAVRTAPTSVRTGAMRLRDDPGLIRGERLGLVTNHTGVMPDLGRNVDALQAAGVNLRALFGPEHGLGGSAQAGASEAAGTDGPSGLPVFDTYRRSGDELAEQLRSSGVDTILYDLQDIGARFYTYVWTMYDVMVAAARTGQRVVILDRPNPIGGLLSEGPGLDPAYTSFVGRADIPLRHGLTCGELARLLNAAAIPAKAGRPVELDVVPVDGWRRSDDADATDLPWVFPSPNIPTLDSAYVYPGTGLVEGTNLSEGRGTTRPFEIVGAPYVDERLAPALNERAADSGAGGLEGVRFRELAFTPTFGKHASEPCRGVQLHVLDRVAFEPVRTAVLLLVTARRLYPDAFGWREPARTGGAKHSPADRLWGSDTLRRALDAGDEDAALGLLPPRSTPRERYDGSVLLYA